MDESIELQDLTNRTLPPEQSCSATVLQREANIPASVDLGGEN